MILSLTEVKERIIRKGYKAARGFYGHSSPAGRRPFEFMEHDSPEDLAADMDHLPDGLLTIEFGKSRGGLSHPMRIKMYVGEAPIAEAKLLSETSSPKAAATLQELKKEMMDELRTELTLKSLQRENQELREQLTHNDTGSEKLASAGYNMLMMVMGMTSPDPAVSAAMQGSRFKGIDPSAAAPENETSKAAPEGEESVDIPEDKKEILNQALFNIVKKFGYADVINIGTNPIVLNALFNQIQASKKQQ